MAFLDFALYAVVVGFGLAAAMRFALRWCDLAGLAEDMIDDVTKGM